MWLAYVREDDTRADGGPRDRRDAAISAHFHTVISARDATVGGYVKRKV